MKIKILIAIFIVSAIISVVTTSSLDVHSSRRGHSINDIRVLEISVDLFRLDNKRYPTNDEGLHILSYKTSDNLQKWKQYMREIPQDSWGEPYIYELNSSGTDFLVYSSGPNRILESGLGDDIIGGEKEYACELYSECTKFSEYVWFGATISALISLLLLIVSSCYYLARFVLRVLKKNKM